MVSAIARQRRYWTVRSARCRAGWREAGRLCCICSVNDDMTEDEQFFAWLDGELDGDKAAEVEARVAASAELTARAAEHRRLSSKLRDAFAPLIEAGAAPPSLQSAEI